MGAALGLLGSSLQDDTAYDTLDDLDIAAIPTLKSLYTAVLGAAIEQKDVCGVLLTGTRAVGARDEEVDGVWGKHMVRFSPQSETWRVRSSPKGRIGKPLASCARSRSWTNVVMGAQHGAQFFF